MSEQTSTAIVPSGHNEPAAPLCTHPAAHRDAYTANGRVFSWCRACDSDVENAGSET